MKATVSVGRAGKGCDTRNYVGNLKLSATLDGDQFILAAIARALFSDEAAKLRSAIMQEAKRCLVDHKACGAQEKENDA